MKWSNRQGRIMMATFYEKEAEVIQFHEDLQQAHYDGFNEIVGHIDPERVVLSIESDYPPSNNRVRQLEEVKEVDESGDSNEDIFLAKNQNNVL
jgi:hypothetical protein